MRLKLEVQNGSLAGQRFELRNGWILVGRGEDCPLRFAGENMVSTRHAIIHALPDGFHLIDQRSTNGTIVNGQRITDAVLHSGDLIQLGVNGPQLLVTIEEQPSAPAPQPQPVLAPQPVPAPPPAPAPVAFVPSVPPMAPPVVSQASSPVFAAPQAVPVSPSAHSAPPASSPSGLRQTMSHLGMYHPDRDQDKNSNPVLTYLALIAGAVLAVLTIGIVTLELGVISAVVCSLVAFIPALHYLFILLWLDRYDPEPGWLLTAAFAWGALFATFVSSIINTIVGGIGGDTLAAVVSAPVIEEATKGIGLLLIALMFRREFDSVADGIVYAGVIALGFATVENISYYGRAFNEAGMQGLVGTFFGRGILSPFAHVLFTGMTGIAVGLARESHSQAKKFGLPVAGYLSAVILHALWNGLASFAGRGFLLAYLIIEVPLFLAFVSAAIWMTRREGRILRDALKMEVGRGLISQEHLDIATSFFGRSRWLASAFSNRQLFGARRRFMRAVTKLGLCHWHATRAASANTQTQSFSLIPRLQAEVFSLRDRVG